MADERKAFQEDLDSLRKWWGHNKPERLGHNFWATLYYIHLFIYLIIQYRSFHLLLIFNYRDRSQSSDTDTHLERNRIPYKITNLYRYTLSVYYECDVTSSFEISQYYTPLVNYTHSLLSHFYVQKSDLDMGQSC